VDLLELELHLPFQHGVYWRDNHLSVAEWERFAPGLVAEAHKHWADYYPTGSVMKKRQKYCLHKKLAFWN
jgi:hypothetical protein